MFRRSHWLLAVGVVLAITACKERATTGTTTSTQPGEDDRAALQAVERTRETLREITDVRVKQLALDNALMAKDPAISAAIQQYEGMAASDRVRFLVSDGRLRDVLTDPSDPPRPDPLIKTERSAFPFTVATQPPDTNFDLAVRQTEMFAQQVRLTNELFRDADPRVMSAIEAWEKMTAEQKRTFTATPEVTAYYWNYVYLTYKLQLLRHYYRFTRQGYWGYKTPAALDAQAMFDPKQFDLKVPGR